MFESVIERRVDVDNPRHERGATTAKLRVLVEVTTKGKRWVAIAADWPGLERNGKSEDEAVAKLVSYVPRYLGVAKRAGLEAELRGPTDAQVVERYTGTGSTDFWGISFAPSGEDKATLDDATFERKLALLRAAWAEFDDIAARVSADLRPGARGGGRSRDAIIRHVLVVEGEDFAKRVKVPTDFEDPQPGRWSTAPRTEIASSTRCASGARKASRSASGRRHTCSVTRHTTSSITRGRCRIAT
jgi:hypothetical protein